MTVPRICSRRTRGAQEGGAIRRRSGCTGWQPSVQDVLEQQAIQDRHRDAQERAEQKILGRGKIAVRRALLEDGFRRHHESCCGETLRTGCGDRRNNDHTLHVPDPERGAHEQIRLGDLKIGRPRSRDLVECLWSVGRRSDYAAGPRDQGLQGSAPHDPRRPGAENDQQGRLVPRRIVHSFEPCGHEGGRMDNAKGTEQGDQHEELQALVREPPAHSISHQRPRMQVFFAPILQSVQKCGCDGNGDVGPAGGDKGKGQHRDADDRTVEQMGRDPAGLLRGHEAVRLHYEVTEEARARSTA